MASPEIQALVKRLRLSPGDVLGLAREVAEDRALLSADHLTAHQQRNLQEMLEFLAKPAFPTREWEHELIGRAS